jgi:hypothetical protein
MDKLIEWLLGGDVSIQYQTERDLLGSERPDLQNRILKEGWGARFLAQRNKNGHWGRGFYQPKWTSSHYSLLDIKNLQPPRDQPSLLETIEQIAETRKADDGGINPGKTVPVSDVCINGMFLDYACYFKIDQGRLESVVDFVLEEHMADGGFNCQRNRSGAVHSSVHSTISVLEGIQQYKTQGYQYRLAELLSAARDAEEFLLMHELFKSDKTGDIIHKDMLRLSFPSRWKYDILRAFEYFRSAGCEWDERMKPAADILMKKRRKDGRWPLQAKHPGELHFEMEKAGKPSRWNTLRALRVLKAFPLNA